MGSVVYPGLRASSGGGREVFHDYILRHHVDVSRYSVRFPGQSLRPRTHSRLDRHVRGLDHKGHCFYAAFPQWEKLLQPVLDSGKRFQFKQGLDERLLTKDKIIKMSKWLYDGEVIFAFDNIEDKNLIISKLMLIRATVPKWTRELKFYVFCGADKNEVYDEAFWEQDIRNLFERIYILKTFDCKPYIMRFEKAYESEYSSFYATVASWCNQPSLFKTMSFRLFSQCKGMRRKGYNKYKRDIDGYLQEYGFKGSEWRSMEMVSDRFPDIAIQYFDFVGKSLNKYEWLDILLDS